VDKENTIILKNIFREWNVFISKLTIALVTSKCVAKDIFIAITTYGDGTDTQSSFPHRSPYKIFPEKTYERLAQIIR
jgi:hypothetical protein